MRKVELQTIQNGAVFDLFNEELLKVLSNIEDENIVDYIQSLTGNIPVIA